MVTKNRKYLYILMYLRLSKVKLQLNGQINHINVLFKLDKITYNSLIKYIYQTCPAGYKYFIFFKFRKKCTFIYNEKKLRLFDTLIIIIIYSSNKYESFKWC